MKVTELINCIDGQLVCGETQNSSEILKAFACDLMSDVLTLDDQDVLLLTGLNNLQTIRTAEMAEIKHIVLVRNKKPSQEMINLANAEGISLIVTAKTLFETSGRLFNAGIKPIIS